MVKIFHLTKKMSERRVTNREKEVSPVPFKIFSVCKTGILGKIVALKVDDGWLIGRDAGEWGGDLYRYSNEGKQNYKISNQQILGFLKSKETIFAITGISHMSFDKEKS